MSKSPERFEVEVIAPRDLSPGDEAAWRGLQAVEPAFSNPLLGPDFSRLVGLIRGDARVAVYRRHGEAAAFLPFHARRFGFARPIGAPFSDYQALVAKRDIGLSGQEALRLAGIRAFRFNGLVDPHGMFSGAALGSGQTAHAIVLENGPDALLEAVRAGSPKKFKNYRRLEHKLERDLGPLRLIAGDRSQDAFDALMQWKRDQFRRTGLQDVLRPRWARAFMQAAFESDDGLMMALYAGDTLVAGHFGVRSAKVYHPWIASADPELAAYSPGHALLAHAIRAMPEAGLEVYDLGPGSDHYKRAYATVEREPLAGALTAVGPASSLTMQLAHSEHTGARSAAKVLRRLDHIAAVDPSPLGMLRGLTEAVQGAAKRGLWKDAQADAAA